MPKLSLLIFLLEFYINFGIIEYTYTLDQNTIIYYIKNLILISSILSLIIGSTVGLSQIRIKRLLAYSTISHLGFMLLALAINTEQSLESFLFYLIQYTITNLNIFFIIIALGLVIHSIRLNKINIEGNENDIQYITELKGLFYENPLLSLSLSICLFSMAGVPPLLGFFSKQFVLYAAVQKGYYFISIVAILVSVISASYYLNVIKVLHIIDNDSKLTLVRNNWEISSIHSFIISTLNLSILFFILKPTLLLNSSTLLSLTLFSF
jgi:NADH-ubiquinone oxidoreductase chain 2